MRICWRTARWPREILFLFAALALAMQVVVPPGYMVGGGADGPTRIVICTLHGPVNAAVDLGGSKGPAHPKTASMPCIFAGHAAPASLASPAPAAGLAWATFTSIALPTDRRVFVGHGLAAPPPARGPPSLI